MIYMVFIFIAVEFIALEVRRRIKYENKDYLGDIKEYFYRHLNKRSVR